jgi:hypothetical protein
MVVSTNVIQQGATIMLTKLALTAVVVLGTASAALAATHPVRHSQSVATNARSAFAAVPAPRQISGAEWWQNRGIVEDQGYVYRR